MNCVTGQKGHFLCINKFCQVKNSFVCSDPNDECKQNHESCSLISLSYLLKKSKIDMNPKNKSNRYQKLVPIYEKSKTIATSINNALASFNIIRQINSLLDQGKQLTPGDKDKIANFMNDKKIEQAQDNIYTKIEKELQEFQFIINQFQISMKEVRNRQIQQLRKKLEKDDRLRTSQGPNAEQYEALKSNVKKLSKLESQPSKQQSSPLKAMKSSALQSNPTQVKSRIFKQQALSPLKSKVIEKPQKIDSDKKKQKNEKNDKIRSSSIRPRPNQFQQKISSTIRNHVPKPPLFSKITNDIQTLSQFFQQSFEQAKLIYRASQNQYLVSKFHQKCDGVKNTLVLVLTQFDKIIGGFTPLPWKSGGGQWYQDTKKMSFLFNLSSGERYPLVNSDKAIWCSHTYGPSFGHPDLEISDKAFYNSNSCANFPNCYNNGNYKNNSTTTQLFCGTKNGHFRIKQWQVYQLRFI